MFRELITVDFEHHMKDLKA